MPPLLSLKPKTDQKQAQPKASAIAAQFAESSKKRPPTITFLPSAKLGRSAVREGQRWNDKGEDSEEELRAWKDDETKTDTVGVGKGDVALAALLREVEEEHETAEADIKGSTKVDDEAGGLIKKPSSGYESTYGLTKIGGIGRRESDRQGSEGGGLEDDETKKSRYVEKLIEHSKLRQAESEIVKERKIAKELAEESATLGDKPQYVTAGYKRRLKEREEAARKLAE